MTAMGQGGVGPMGWGPYPPLKVFPNFLGTVLYDSEQIERPSIYLTIKNAMRYANFFN